MITAEQRIAPNADTAPLTERQLLLLKHPLHELTHEHDDTALIERFLLEVEGTDWPEDTKSRVHGALALAIEAHESQTRGEYPYSTHFLRVATRILSSNHFSIRDQPDLIISGLLHDAPEDRASELIKALCGVDLVIAQTETPSGQETTKTDLALNILGYYFGDTVERLVGSVTNPPSDYSLTKPERNGIYREHVRNLLVNNPLAGIIKLSDFIDNAAGLKYNENQKNAKILANKYQDLVSVFAHFVEQSEYLMPDVKYKLLAHLEKIFSRCIKYSSELILPE